jgi:polysaccharide export outer membrane protein
VRVARAFRLPIIAATTALALSGCMHTASPVATAQPQGDLDYMAYGQPYAPAPANVATYPSTDSGGAISALRTSFAAASSPHVYPSAPVVYAAAPTPVAYDTAYRLDAGDKLRVVVFGQEGLTNSYAIDAGGSITMPLIGSVPARGRTPAALAAEITGKLRNGYIRDPSVAVEIESYRPFFILGEVAARHRARSRRYRSGRRTLVLNQTVIAGLDPAIHLAKNYFLMDARVKPAHDERYFFTSITSSNAWRRIRRCGSARCRRWPCRNWRALRN